MRAIHVCWTRPKTFKLEDFEILTAVISAMSWRKNNGSIALVTDSNGADFFRGCGLDVLWNDGISTELDDIPQNINPEIFWACGKIFALKVQKMPVAVMDTDFIVWDKLDFDAYSDAAVIHFEDITEVYPPKEFFKMKEKYSFPEWLDWDINACNTAFYAVKNQNFVKRYTDTAIRFMENAEDTGDRLHYMIFAEQRLFNMCAKAEGINVTGIAGLEKLYNENKSFTHLWGMKQQMRGDENLRRSFCRDCIKRIESDYPEILKVLRNMNCFDEYFN